MKVKIYLEIDNMGEDENGHPCPAGCVADLGTSPVEIDYDELVADINLSALEDFFNVPRGSAKFITPEEYAEKYGED